MRRRAALAAVDAAHLEARPVTELSDGKRQSVALARALAQEPECLLLDEPSAALDLKHRAGLVRHLRRLRDEQNMTALIITHDLMLLDPAFDSVFAMRCGETVAAGTPSEVLRDEVLAGLYGDEHVRAPGLRPHVRLVGTLGDCGLRNSDCGFNLAMTSEITKTKGAGSSLARESAIRNPLSRSPQSQEFACDARSCG